MFFLFLKIMFNLVYMRLQWMASSDENPSKVAWIINMTLRLVCSLKKKSVVTEKGKSLPKYNFTIYKILTNLHENGT